MQLRTPNLWLGLLLASTGLTGACGPDDVFVSAALSQDAQCKYAPLEENAILHGNYDAAPSIAGPGTPCLRSFDAHLLVRNDNANDITVTSAEVHITTQRRETVIFDRDHKHVLPNPFVTTASGPLPRSAKGVAIVEVIPRDYGEQLSNFDKTTLLAEIKLSTKTDDGDDVSSNSFTLPIAICYGCDTICASDAAPNANTDSCNDEDYCADPGC